MVKTNQPIARKLSRSERTLVAEGYAKSVYRKCLKKDPEDRRGAKRAGFLAFVKCVKLMSKK